MSPREAHLPTPPPLQKRFCQSLTFQIVLLPKSKTRRLLVSIPQDVISRLTLPPVSGKSNANDDRIVEPHNSTQSKLMQTPQNQFVSEDTGERGGSDVDGEIPTERNLNTNPLTVQNTGSVMTPSAVTGLAGLSEENEEDSLNTSSTIHSGRMIPTASNSDSLGFMVGRMSSFASEPVSFAANSTIYNPEPCAVMMSATTIAVVPIDHNPTGISTAMNPATTCTTTGTERIADLVSTTTASVTRSLANTNSTTSAEPATLNVTTTRPVQPGFAELDKKLSYTCRDMCGSVGAFPCSCDASCFVHRTCCENITQDCPHTVQEGLTRFERIRRSKSFCSKNMIYMIASCPSNHSRNTAAHTADLSDLEEFRWRGSEGIHDKDSSTVLTSVTASSLTTPGVSRRENVPTRGLRDRLEAAFLTDQETGFTFINRTIYDCHGMPDKSAVSWAIDLNYDFINPTDLEALASGEGLDRFVPGFNTYTLQSHACLPLLIDTCNQTGLARAVELLGYSSESVRDKCQKTTALVASSFKTYRNRYCFYCNQEYDQEDAYLLRAATSVGIPEKVQGLRLLMSTSGPSKFRLRLNVPAAQVRGVLVPWERASCSLSSLNSNLPGTSGLAAGTSSSCSVTCRGRFTLRSDGYCKAPHRAKVALAADHHPLLCPAALTGLARFISCGLEARLTTLKHAEFRSPTASVQVDTRLNQTLYVTMLNVDLPSLTQNVFSTSSADNMVNIHHIALLVKSFHKYGFIGGVCTGGTKERVWTESELKRIYTNTASSIYKYGKLVRSMEHAMMELRGHVVDRNATLVCFSEMDGYLNKEMPVDLICYEDLVHQSDLEVMGEIRSSQCFKHLHIRQPGHNGAQVVRRSRLTRYALLISLSLSYFFNVMYVHVPEM